MVENESGLAPSQRLRVAYLLTFVGGFLDAYTYFERGGVFANAQTGNIVKLGIALSNGERDSYLFFLLPILSFALGLVTALSIAEFLNRRGLRLVRRSVLLIEMVGLAIVGFVPLGAEWDTLANCIVSYVAAMQYEAFTTFRGEVIATTMSTGNLRKFVDNTFGWLVRKETERVSNAFMYASILVIFTLGAFYGTRACDAFGRAAVVPAIIFLGIAVAIITHLRKKNSVQE